MKGTSKKQNNTPNCGDVAYIVDLRIGRFSDFPAIPRGRSAAFWFQSHSARKHRSAFSSSLFFSSLLLHPDGTKSRGRQWWSSRKGKRMARDEGNGPVETEFNFSRSRSSPFPREFSFHFARPPRPLFHSTALFAENSELRLPYTDGPQLPSLPLIPPSPFSSSAPASFVIFYFLRCDVDKE